MLFPYKKDPSSPCRLTVNQLAGRGGHVFLTGNSRFLSLKELAIGRLFLVVIFDQRPDPAGGFLVL